MRRKLIILSPYPITNIVSFRFGFDLLKKKINIQIHDLSDLLISKKFQDKWKSRRKKNVIKFKSFLSWFFFILKEPSSTIIFNLSSAYTYRINCFFIKLTLSIKSFTVIILSYLDVVEVKLKKNLKYFISKIFIQHKYDFIFYLNSFKKILITYLNNFITYKKEIILTNKKLEASNLKKNKFFCNIHSYDYSIFLRSKYKKKKKKFFVFLDTGFPFFSGDQLLLNSIEYKIDENKLKKIHDDSNFFFTLLEKKFKRKVLIVPHPKLRGSSYYNKNFYVKFEKFNKFNTNDAVREAYCVLINTPTTSLSFAVFNYKPIVYLTSKNLASIVSNNLSALVQVKKTLSLFDIKKFYLDKKENFNKIILRVNRKKYDKYKFQYLQNPRVISNKKNSDIIYKFIKNNT